jgi:hypothetical protein
MHRTLSDGQKGVLHDDFDLNQELLELSVLINLFVGLIEVVPALRGARGLLEVLHNCLLNGLSPLVLEVVSSRSDRPVLGALKVPHTHCMSDVGVVDISEIGIVALFPDDLHNLDNFILAKQGVKAELRELLRKVMRRYANEAEVRLFFRGGVCWKLKTA